MLLVCHTSGSLGFFLRVGFILEQLEPPFVDLGFDMSVKGQLIDEMSTGGSENTHTHGAKRKRNGKVNEQRKRHARLYETHARE